MRGVFGDFHTGWKRGCSVSKNPKDSMLDKLGAPISLPARRLKADLGSRYHEDSVPDITTVWVPDITCLSTAYSQVIHSGRLLAPGDGRVGRFGCNWFERETRSAAKLTLDGELIARERL